MHAALALVLAAAVFTVVEASEIDELASQMADVLNPERAPRPASASGYF
jgi:hypothetical protein